MKLALILVKRKFHDQNKKNNCLSSAGNMFVFVDVMQSLPQYKSLFTEKSVAAQKHST